MPAIQRWLSSRKSTIKIDHINKLKEKNNDMVISTNAKKAFEKIQHTFILTVLKQKCMGFFLPGWNIYTSVLKLVF